MAKTIHLLVGHTGEWEDAYDWNVCAFTSLRQAQKELDRLKELTGRYTRHLSPEEMESLAETLQEAGDLACSVDSNGVYYRLETLTLTSPAKRSSEKSAAPRARSTD